MNKKLWVDLKDNPYPIHWDDNHSSFTQLIKNEMGTAHNTVITNDKIYSIYKNLLINLFSDNIIILPDGEEQKNLSSVSSLLDKIFEKKLNRKSRLWAFGGGVIGDITGFLASIYMRGIDFYQIPTTLLSMVDSSVGGKTGVNLPAGKNLAGTFYQPKAVFIHTPFLQTLPDREIKSGLSEVIKSALIKNFNLFQFLNKNSKKINDNDIETFSQCSYESVKIKAEIVTEDERELGIRAILNYGHTLAHALESYYQYKVLTHGEAVSIGMAFATYLSLKLNKIEQKEFTEILSLLKQLNLKYSWKDLPQNNLPGNEDIISLMKGDKKNIDNDIQFILLKSTGNAILPEKIKQDTLIIALEEFKCL